MPYDRTTHTFQMDWEYPPDYQPGDFYLGGVDGREFGYRLSKHGSVVGNARSGKGVAYLIPNILRWPQNLIVVDPKGENVSLTWEARVKMGQKVRVFDPFFIANVPDELRFSFNPLDGIGPEALGFWEEVMILVNALVTIHNPKDGHWDGGTKTIIAGMVAQLLDPDVEFAAQDLPALRKRLLHAVKDLPGTIEKLRKTSGLGGLPAAAAEAFARTGKESEHFISGALENTGWVDSEEMQRALHSSDFRMKDLKYGKTDVFLVLPVQYVDLHAKFLRLFIRYALNAMAPEIGGDEGAARKCLFLLDEFHALGRLDEVIQRAGAMPGYGVHMVFFAQDINQLYDIYGRDQTRILLSNCDFQLFFGMMDDETPKYVSEWINVITHADLKIAPAQLEAVDTYPVPPNPVDPALPSAVPFDPALFASAVSAPVPPAIPHFHSQKSPLGAALGNMALQAMANTVHQARLVEASAAREVMRIQEMERQVDYQVRRVDVERRAAAARAKYEKAMAFRRYAQEEARRRYENERAVIAHALTFVGKPRVTPYEARVGTAKPSADKLAQAALVLLPEGVRITKPKAYFEEDAPRMLEHGP